MPDYDKIPLSETCPQAVVGYVRVHREMYKYMKNNPDKTHREVMDHIMTHFRGYGDPAIIREDIIHTYWLLHGENGE